MGKLAPNLTLHRTRPGQQVWRCKASIYRTLQPASRPSSHEAGRQVGRNTYEAPTEHIVHPAAPGAGEGLVTSPGLTNKQA